MELAELNQPVIMELKFDAPLKGESKFGVYYAYAVDCNGEEMTFFSPNDEVNQKLISLKRGAKVQITKTAKQNGKGIKVDYDVIVLEEKKSEPADVPNPQEEYYYTAMEKSFEEALRLQNKFNGMANVNQIAITLFIQRTKGSHSFSGG